MVYRMPSTAATLANHIKRTVVGPTWHVAGVHTIWRGSAEGLRDHQHG
jgi:hypothetical protein